MEVINGILTELVDISQEYNDGIIDKDELNLKLDLIKIRIESIEINYRKQPLDYLDDRIRLSFNQLLFRAKFKSLSSIQLLKDTKNRKSYNAKLRFILKNKLFFNQLHRTLQRNIEAYVKKNDLMYHNPNTPTFRQRGNDNDSK
jgi:hypothetical protein